MYYCPLRPRNTDLDKWSFDFLDKHVFAGYKFDSDCGKSRTEIFEEMVSQVRHLQRGLVEVPHTEVLRMRIINACWNVYRCRTRIKNQPGV